VSHKKTSGPLDGGPARAQDHILAENDLMKASSQTPAESSPFSQELEIKVGRAILYLLAVAIGLAFFILFLPALGWLAGRMFG